MAERDDAAQAAISAAIEHLEGNSSSILESADPAVVELETALFSGKFLSECMDVVTPDTDPEGFSPILAQKFRGFRLEYEIRKRLEGDTQTADIVSRLSMVDLVPTIRDRVVCVAAVVKENEQMLAAMRKYGVILKGIPIPSVKPSK